MQRSRWPLTLALITFLLALGTGFHTYQTFIQTVPVLVAAADLPAGAPLSQDQVRVRRVPAGGRPPSALFGPGQAVGRYAAVPLFAEQMLTERHLTSEPSRVDPLKGLAPGQRVISIPVRPETVLGGALQPGDLVDVAVAWPAQDGRAGSVKVLAPQIPVVDLRNPLGRSTMEATAADTESIAAVPVTALLMVTPEQAYSLVEALEAQASIYLWLTGRGPS